MKRKKVALVTTVAVCAIMCSSNTVTFASGYTEENQDEYSYDEYADTGTGFSFANYNAHEMMKTIDYALKVYDEDPEAWKGIMTRAMQAKLDWDASADQYLKVFNSLIG